jgi:hypothetical protein
VLAVKGRPRSGLAFKGSKNGTVRTITIGAGLASLQTHKAKQAEEQLPLREAYAKGGLVFAQPDGSVDA